jgi:hypothetical protein
MTVTVRRGSAVSESFNAVSRSRDVNATLTDWYELLRL